MQGIYFFIFASCEPLNYTITFSSIPQIKAVVKTRHNIIYTPYFDLI